MILSSLSEDDGRTQVHLIPTSGQGQAVDGLLKIGRGDRQRSLITPMVVELTKTIAPSLKQGGSDRPEEISYLACHHEVGESYLGRYLYRCTSRVHRHRSHHRTDRMSRYRLDRQGRRHRDGRSGHRAADDWRERRAWTVSLYACCGIAYRIYRLYDDSMQAVVPPK